MADLLPFLRLFLRRAPWLVAGGLLMLTTALAGIALLGLSGWFVTASALAGSAALGAGFNVLRPSAGIRFLAVFRTASRYAERLATHEATFRLLADLRAWLFRRALPLDAAQLGRLRAGDLLARLTADVDALDNLYLRVLAPSFVALVTGVLALVVLWPVDGTLALAVVAAMALSGVAVPLLARRLGERTGRGLVADTAALRTRLVDAFQALAELRVFGAIDREAAGVGHAVDTLARRQRRMGRIAGLSAALSSLFAGAALWIALALGTALASAGTIDAAVLAALALGVVAVFEVVAPLPTAFQYLGKTRAAARRLAEVARLEPSVRDPDRPATPPAGNAIAFHGVSLRYDRDGPPVLDRLDLDLPEGRRVAVMGPSGSGKTSLARLLLRLWDPDEGSVTLGEVDLRRLRQTDLHARIGYLSQHEPLFNATIRDNLLIGRADADEPALRGTLRAVRLERFVDALPAGLDTWVGEAGLLLSGGQARRIALARLLLKDAPILVLDEPTEGLDEATEAEVWDTLARFVEGRTALLITHRPAGLAAMDTVLRMEDGHLAPIR